MTDKDSWWKDDAVSSKPNTPNPFTPRDVQSDATGKRVKLRSKKQDFNTLKPMVNPKKGKKDSL